MQEFMPIMHSQLATPATVIAKNAQVTAGPLQPYCAGNASAATLYCLPRLQALSDAHTTYSLLAIHVQLCASWVAWLCRAALCHLSQVPHWQHCSLCPSPRSASVKVISNSSSRRGRHRTALTSPSLLHITVLLCSRWRVMTTQCQFWTSRGT